MGNGKLDVNVNVNVNDAIGSHEVLNTLVEQFHHELTLTAPV